MHSQHNQPWDAASAGNTAQAPWNTHILDRQPAPHGPLESAMDSVANGMQEAFSALERLAEGLRLVLQPEVPMPADTTGNVCSTPPTSPVVSQLNSLRDQLDVLTSRMNALRCRLDA